MGEHPFKNLYSLTDEQLASLDAAEEAMERGRLTESEKILLEMLEHDENCIPVLSNLGHLHGKYFSEYETAVQYYEKVINLEPDNAWARDERRKYLRWLE